MHRRRVAFHETDAAGIAHFSNTLRWFEEAEHAFLRAIGTSVYLPEPDGGYLSYPRVDVGASYRAPVRFEDEVEVEVEVRKVGRSSVTYGFVVRQAVGGVCCATGHLTVVCSRKDPLHGGLRSAPLPDHVREALLTACAGSPNDPSVSAEGRSRPAE